MPRGGGDKKVQFWAAIMDAKLDRVRWGVANAGVAPATRREEDGMTSYMLACAAGKDRSLAEMILFHERRLGQLRECLVQVHDNTGQSCMHLACANPQGVKCVALLLDAWLRVDSKNREAWNVADFEGKTPRDLAKGKTLALLDEWVAESDDDDDDDDQDESQDTMTSTQRNKLKKRALQANERRGAAEPTSPRSAKGEAVASDERGELPSEMPEPHWPEVLAWVDSVKKLRPICELSVSRDPPEDGEPCQSIDPALWFCASLNRLQLKLPGLGSIQGSGLAKLANLSTLILAGNALAALPASLGDLPIKSLDASRNKLTSLPEFMPLALEALDVSHNDLDSLAPLGPCIQLVTLSTDANRRLADLGALDFGSLRRLVHLSASSCALVDLPPDLGLAAKLETLLLSDNPFTTLPTSLANCKKLKDVKVDRTNIADNKVLGYIQKAEFKQLAKYWEKNSGGSKKGGSGAKKGKR